MAIVRAVKSGNWSDTTVWNTGTLPTSADDVYSNTFTVTIDVSPTVLRISNAATTGVTAGGGFVIIVGGLTITCTGEGVVAGTTVACVTSNLTSGQSLVVVGNCKGGTGAGGHGIINASSGTLNVIGDCTGGGGYPTGGVTNNSSGTVNITGNCYSTLTGSGTSPGADNRSSGTINITGNCIGGGGFNVTGGAANNNGNGTINITGNCIGGSSNSPGAANSSIGIMTVVGSVVASSTVAGIGAGNIGQTTFLTGPFIGTAQGVAANVALRWRWVTSVGPSYMTVPNSTATGYKNFYTADSVDSASGQPAANNVRSGTVFGPAGELTGTCAVPPASSVALGVPVDNTTGTAILTQAAVEAAITNGLTAASAATFNQPINTLNTPGSIGERLKNSATVATVSQQISDVFSSRQ